VVVVVARTVVSSKGQVVIPKRIRDMLGLTPGTVLSVWVEGKRIIMEPLREPPEKIFVRAGPKVTERILREAKASGDKAERLMRDLGVMYG